jgi:hypothetical protein
MEIRAAVDSNAEAKRVIQFMREGGDYEISVDPSASFVLRGTEDLIRWYSEPDPNVSHEKQVMYALRRFSLQKALLAIHGEGGEDFRDDESLLVQLEPYEGSAQKCVVGNGWVQAPANQLQLIPVCKSWKIKVSLSEDVPFKLRIGGFIASSSGRLTPITRQQEIVTLTPGGKSWVSPAFKSSPPTDVDDFIVVVGTREEQPIDWWHFLQLADEGLTRGMAGDSPLLRALKDYVTVAARGDVTEDDSEVSTWTRTIVPIRVVAGSAFIDAKVDETIDKREYTVNDFNIAPYLPDSTQTALFRVLTKADELARASYSDGYGYKQHAWQEGSDRNNLGKGIDCSRAIWFAFTRAGLPYNKTDRYLTTADMVGADSPMVERFELCEGSKDTLQVGDILVYRDDTRGDGHVVMAIDPRNQVAWGSHGWDGNAPELSGELKPDTGIEYQKIKYKADWNRWDRKTMELKACWRYRDFIEERMAARGDVGIQSARCNPDMCLLQ